MEEIDFSKVCGCCLSTGDLSPMSDEAIKLVAFCFSIQILKCNSSFNSSTLICDLCNRKIKVCHEFRRQILDCQMKLKNSVKRKKMKEESSVNFKNDNENINFINSIEELLSDLDDEEFSNSSLISDRADEINFTDTDFEEDIQFNKKQKMDLSWKMNSIKINTQKGCSEIETKQKFQSNTKMKPIEKSKSLKQSQNQPKYEFNRLNKEETVCKICGEKFTFNKLLVSHMGVHYPNYVCDVCGKPYAIRNTFLSHVKRHKEEDVSCIICKKIVKSSTLRKHMETHSEKKKHFSCPQCSERFVEYHRRVKHMEEVHNVDIYIHHCKFCPRKFYLSNHLSAHTRRSHLKEWNVTCGICEKRFFSMSNLNNHMNKHTGEKKYQCDICSKRYTSRWNLKLHLKSHGDNVEKHKCILCEKEFTQKCSLMVHIKNIHEKL